MTVSTRLEELPARLVAAVGLLAVIPAALAATGRMGLSVIVAIVNVALIVACLYVAFSADSTRVARLLGVEG